MSILQGKKIILGITGGIAAYKSAVLVRALKQAGADVRVVMTAGAQAFITPLTLQALSGNPVFTKLLDVDQESAMGHIELSRWADLVLAAPASAHFLARLAHGLADDLLTTLCLASSAPIAVAPAMNQQMWRNPATQANCRVLRERNILLWGPGEGEQACGEVGPGRMLEPDQLVAEVEAIFMPGLLSGVRVVMTAGPTREPIDPVRFIGNRSSGKMGYALAAALRNQGASVRLVSGPTGLPIPQGVDCEKVETAQQMFDAVMERVATCDIFVGVAAVSDYRPAQPAGQKIKKNAEQLDLTLVRNPDILATVAALKPAPLIVGFAAETERIEEQAETKRKVKGIDLIAVNQVGGGRGGFEADDNALILLWDGGREELPFGPKDELARQLARRIAQAYQAKEPIEAGAVTR